MKSEGSPSSLSTSNTLVFDDHLEYINVALRSLNCTEINVSSQQSEAATDDLPTLMR